MEVVPGLNYLCLFSFNAKRTMVDKGLLKSEPRKLICVITEEIQYNIPAPINAVRLVAAAVVAAGRGEPTAARLAAGIAMGTPPTDVMTAGIPGTPGTTKKTNVGHFNGMGKFGKV